MQESSKLYGRFLSKSDYQLIEIVEASESYTPVAVDVAKEIIEERDLSEEFLCELATQFWSIKFKAEIKSYLKNQDIPNSLFLNQAELKALMKFAYDDYLQKRESMGVDSTKYWFV